MQKTLDAEMVASADSVAKIPTAFFHGTVIGQYKGHEIFDTITDNHGVVRTFNGIFVKDMPLKAGSIIAKPGLIYQMA